MWPQEGCIDLFLCWMIYLAMYVIVLFPVSWIIELQALFIQGVYLTLAVYQHWMMQGSTDVYAFYCPPLICGFNYQVCLHQNKAKCFTVAAYWHWMICGHFLPCPFVQIVICTLQCPQWFVLWLWLPWIKCQDFEIHAAYRHWAICGMNALIYPYYFACLCQICPSFWHRQAK